MSERVVVNLGDLAPTYSPYRAIEAEGARIGLMTCLRCGAAVIVGEQEDAGLIHDVWHATVASSTGEGSDG